MSSSFCPTTNRFFQLSKKKGKEAWVEPIIDSSQSPPVIKFEVKTGEGKPIEGTVSRKGAICLACATPTNLDYIRSEGKAGRMDAQLMAIVAEGDRGRIYLSPNDEHEKIAASAKPDYNSLVTSWSEISRLAAMEQTQSKMVQGELEV